MNLNSYLSLCVTDGHICPWDWIEVFKGDSNTAPSLGRYCGDTIPQEIKGQGNLYIEFVTDWIVTKKGFRATYNIIRKLQGTGRW